ncbi:MAG: hypothetical protein PCFJNLEI_00103 [Verrucomicrobiae bacterium]|nr:hypothetical protein [Verrucomicrobiae bacterium]
MKNLQDHGVAVYNGYCRSYKAWRDHMTGRDYVYAGIFGTPSLIVQLDVVTGRCRQFALPKGCYGPWGLEFTVEGHVLATSCEGKLCRLNPRTGKLWVTAKTDQWLWDITHGADGKFYLATSPEAHLIRYDAATEKIEDLGRMDPKLKHLRSVVGGDDGYVYGGLGIERTQVVAYHIATGRTTALLPKADCGRDFASVGRREDGKIYARAVTGNTYRLAHGAAFPAKKANFAAPTLPDGRAISVIDPEIICVGDRRYPLQYKSDGTGIFHLAAGPNQTVYGSTIMPLYLFRYTPKTKKLENLGRGAPDNGEAYSFGHVDGKLYYGCYSFGSLMCYDPAKPWNGDMKWKTNPRLVTNLGVGHNRPRAMCIDAQKRIWIAGNPEYGAHHGGLGCYNTIAKKYVNQPVVIPDQSIWALAANETGDVIYGGTTIGRGSGTDPVTKEAHLIAWDARRRKLLWKQAAVPGAVEYSNLLFRDGKLYGTTSKPFTFFCFDPQKRAMDYLLPSEISGVREQSMCFGPDGNIYGITWMVLFRWRPESGQIEELYRCTGRAAKPFGGSLFHRGAIIIDGRYYFSCGAKVMSLPVDCL